jgi:uncharacterized protein (DUF4213/DUF364 family)
MGRPRAATLLDRLVGSLPEGKIERVCIGLHWTAVVAVVAGVRRCGLASTISGRHIHGRPDVANAGTLTALPARELAAWSLCGNPTQRSVGLAAINALANSHPGSWTDQNAEQALCALGVGKRVVLVGHFPFVDRVRGHVGELAVLEKDPQPGDLAAAAAGEVIPKADVVAITAVTLLNLTFTALMALCPPRAFVILLGPSSPLSPLVFNHGVDMVCGSVVTDPERVLLAVQQGATFRQLHRAGVRLVTMTRPQIPADAV